MSATTVPSPALLLGASHARGKGHRWVSPHPVDHGYAGRTGCVRPPLTAGTKPRRPVGSLVNFPPTTRTSLSRSSNAQVKLY
ncbi:hypothetical protein PF005_g17791 [Phytophthora fragariae]|uniref:Uncharacterized protein n=1 Tax=Phytophthora fragariae TaxID=53985 RepID=A0A6A3X9D2_9STRA|nr:hypothetical protein PF003_g8582 [Phytophthora fragariae]KAE8931019.1 hypothetical protein PF009_g18908 [Phytophthora fragariae]KAE8999414.1 hypothetical protein PF011_g14635 [Phytophthora fragariae]KAE9094890.1 hypothetical protein PF007_g17596 [Phytophthora fragariae]KAE9096878.1 hypothetical protein PF010_g16167 [Phytophthora fragariae]